MRQLIALPYLLIAGFAPMSEGLPSENLIQTNFGEFLFHAIGSIRASAGAEEG